MTASVCSANYVVKNGKLYMKLYTENDVEEVEAYPEPYCFVPSAYDVESKFPIRVENTSLKTLDTNENVKKYSFMFPAHVKNFRDNIERFGRRVYEGDIPYTKRWMIDNNIKCPSYENVKAYWDIEVLDTNGFPDQETASEPIIAISVKRDGIETFQGDEKDILSNFLSYLKEEHVRLLIGWNSDWDKEYFVKRCRKNGVNVDEHSIRFLDIMQFYRYTVNRSRYSLSYVAKEFNETKPYEGKRMKDLKKEEIRERNVWDTLMTEKVDMKFHFSKLAIHLAQMSNLFPDLVLGKREDKNTVTPSPVHTNIILKRARALGYVCPSYVERTHEKYKGAYIHMPKSGIYENILQYDFSSLYPNILIGFELAPWNRKEVFIPIVKEYLE
jgi:DNA polymerase elongation subunit (family B)